MGFIRRHVFLMSMLLMGVVFVSVIGIRLAAPPGEATPPQRTRVTLVDVRTLRGTSGIITADGTIESLEQAELRSQVSAPVSRIYARIGESVAEGQLIVSLASGDFTTQLSQAEAGLRSQEARLAELRKGARIESIGIKETELRKAEQDLRSTYENVPTTLNDAYVKADGAVRSQIDGIFTNTETGWPQLTFQTNDSQAETDAVSGRADASLVLNAWKARLNKLSASSTPADLDSALQYSQDQLATIRGFLGNVADAVRAHISLSPTTANTYAASVNAASTNLNIALTTINGTVQSISAQKNGIQRITEELSLMKAGATAEQIEAQEALVAQARAGVQSLQVQVAKTAIRAPFGGTVATLPVRVGELLNPGQLVASIVNVQGLQVKAYVSGEDFNRIAEGSVARIDGAVAGKVIRIAPSIDPRTKKVEVNILLTPAEKSFVVGQTVRVEIERVAESGAAYRVPLQALRITPTGVSVYVVNADSVIEERSVTTGEVHGEFMDVLGGLSDDMRIVSPVYELKVGQTVSVSGSTE